MELLKQLNINNPENPLDDFERIADSILNQHILKVGDKSYRICSIEFYYQQAQHLDKATHAHNRQLSCGEWYFHGSGLDITFGDNTEYGGILIQSILALNEPKEFINGPLKTVTKIFEGLGSIAHNEFSFGLEPYQHFKEEIISAPRVGLNEKTVGDHFTKGYRFLIMPKEAHARKIDIIDYLVSSGKMTEVVAKEMIYK